MDKYWEAPGYANHYKQLSGKFNPNYTQVGELVRVITGDIDGKDEDEMFVVVNMRTQRMYTCQPLKGLDKCSICGRYIVPSLETATEEHNRQYHDK